MSTFISDDIAPCFDVLSDGSYRPNCPVKASPKGRDLNTCHQDAVLSGDLRFNYDPDTQTCIHWWSCFPADDYDYYDYDIPYHTIPDHYEFSPSALTYEVLPQQGECSKSFHYYPPAIHYKLDGYMLIHYMIFFL